MFPSPLKNNLHLFGKGLFLSIVSFRTLNLRHKHSCGWEKKTRNKNHCENCLKYIIDFGQFFSFPLTFHFFLVRLSSETQCSPFFPFAPLFFRKILKWNLLIELLNCHLATKHTFRCLCLSGGSMAVTCLYLSFKFRETLLTFVFIIYFNYKFFF